MILDVEIVINNFFDGFLEWNRRQIKKQRWYLPYFGQNGVILVGKQESILLLL
jgi:hypothetical protein